MEFKKSNMINLVDPITFLFRTILQLNVSRIRVKDKINIHSIPNILILYRTEVFLWGKSIFLYIISIWHYNNKIS